MTDLEITYAAGSKKSYSAEHIPANVIDSFKEDGKEITNIHARFSSDNQTLGGNIYTDFMERDFSNLDQLSVHLANS